MGRAGREANGAVYITFWADEYVTHLKTVASHGHGVSQKPPESL